MAELRQRRVQNASTLCSPSGDCWASNCSTSSGGSGSGKGARTGGGAWDSRRAASASVMGGLLAGEGTVGSSVHYRWRRKASCEVDRVSACQQGADWHFSVLAAVCQPSGHARRAGAAGYGAGRCGGQFLTELSIAGGANFLDFPRFAKELCDEKMVCDVVCGGPVVGLCGVPGLWP